MNILMLTSEYPPSVGGVGSHVFELANALSEGGDRVEVVTLAVKGMPTKSRQGDIIVQRPRLLAGMPFYDWHLRSWLRTRLAQGDIDVVHVHGLRGAAAVRGLNMPCVFTNHTSGFLKRLSGSTRKIQRTAARIAHFPLVLAPSEELCEAVHTVGFRGELRYIANGVDARRFSPGERSMRELWRVDTATPVILLARRLVEKNGVQYFAEALTYLKDERFLAVVAGDGSERHAFEAIVKRADLSAKVIMLGSVLNTEMPAIYRAADISVLPSLMEATSITGLESMAAALPLVGTAVGGIPALIDEGETGYLVPPRAPEAMAEALRPLLRSPELRMRLGRAGRLKVEQQFTWDVIARRTRAEYVALLSKSVHE